MTNSTNKIALVTGGSRGLGRDMALQLADKGFDVIFTYHSKKERADSVVGEINSKGQKASAIQLDVADASSFDGFVSNVLEELTDTYGTDRIDAMVNNAGTGLHQPYTETSEEGFDSMIKIHVKAPFFLTQKLLPAMNDGGSIVNISSGLTRFSFPGYSAYGIAKTGVESLTTYLARELGDRGIRVNTVAPGAIETDFGGGAVRDNADVNNMISSLTVLGRVGMPDDVGGVVAFLCSEESKWVNAQRIEVSGGIFV